MKPGRGSGSASAVTMTSCSALATTTRSNGSVSSAVRRSTRGPLPRSARSAPACPAAPLVSPTRPTWSPTTTRVRPEFAGAHRGHRGSGPSSTAQVQRPRSTATTMPARRRRGPGGSWCAGGSRAAGPDPDVVVVAVRRADGGSRATRTPAVEAAASASTAGEVGQRLRRRCRCRRSATPGTRGRSARRRWPSGGRRRRTRPACSGSRADDRDRRSVSLTSPPSAPSSAASAASRSVSWPRRCAMPRSREGCRANTASAATVGVSSPTSCRSTSMPGSWSPLPVTVRPASSRMTVGAHRGRGWSRMRVAGLVGASPASRHGDRAAGDRGRGQERGGVGQVGLDDPVPAARSDRAGPASVFGLVCRRPRRPPPGAWPRSSRCAAATAPVCRRGAR